jgi:hypothetical protein
MLFAIKSAGNSIYESVASLSYTPTSKQALPFIGRQASIPDETVMPMPIYQLKTLLMFLTSLITFSMWGPINSEAW